MSRRFTTTNGVLWLVSVVLYVWACSSTAVTRFDGADFVLKDRAPSGLQCLLLGWLSLLMGQLCWMANPLWFAVLIGGSRVKTLSGAHKVMVLSAVAMVLSWHALFLDVSFALGFFLWQASLVAAFAGSFVRLAQVSNEPTDT